MSLFKYRKELLLANKIENEEQVKVYFNKLKTYFALVTGDDFYYDNKTLHIEVTNNFGSPPIRFLGSYIPEGKRNIFFNFCFFSIFFI